LLNKKIAAIVAASGLAVAGLALGITPAKAFDPVSNSYAIVGSDTLEDVAGALANGTNVTGSGVRVTTSDRSTIASFDATGTGTIITKPFGNRFQRPNGSGDGRTALKAAIAGTNYISTFSGKDGNYDGKSVVGQIDIVRGSSGGTTISSGVMQRYTFGRDAIAYAYGSGLTNASNITDADMVKIYQCDTTTLNKYGITKAIIPQSGSGTRNDFIARLALTDSTVTDSSIIALYDTASQPGCIHVGQEHDASTLATTEIMPMSASRWIAMSNGVSYKKINTGVQLGSLVSGVSAVTGTAPSLLPVVAYYKDSTWGRDTYLFVDKRRVDSTNTANYDPVLAALFDYNNETSLTYQGGSSFNYTNMTTAPSFFAYTAAAVKLKFGFLPSSVQDTQFAN
jgi:hypothetical protein